MTDDLPIVQLELCGDAYELSGSGATSDGISWFILAIMVSAHESRCRVVVDDVHVADITVHDTLGELSDETQTICAALVWSAIRAVRMRRDK